MMTNNELDEFLCKNYPKMFAGRNKSPNESCLAFGLEIGDGWSNILHQLCSCIQHRIDQSVKSHETDMKFNDIRQAAKAGDWTLFNAHYTGFDNQFVRDMRADINKMPNRPIRKIVPQVEVMQVKEKFGGLRFYYNGGDEEIAGMVRMAEAMSECTCETCGSPGQRSSGGWITVRCEEHGGEPAEEDENEY